MEVRSTFGDALSPGLNKWYEDGFKMFKPYLDLVFNVEDSMQAFEEEQSNSGVGYMEETNEAGSVKYEDRLQGYKARYEHKKFTKGISISREEFEDNLYMKRKGEVISLGKTARRTPDNHAFSVFRNAFSTSFVGPDGSALCAADHPRKDGGSNQSNTSTSALSEVTLNTGILAMQQVLDHKGQGVLIAESGITLMIPPALRKLAVEITGSERRSDTANNDLNFYKGSINVLVVPWISNLFSGSDTAWFLLAPKDEHKLKFFWRRRPAFEQEEIFDTEVAKWKVSARYSYGWSDWYGVYGSTGTV